MILKDKAFFLYLLYSLEWDIFNPLNRPCMFLQYFNFKPHLFSNIMTLNFLFILDKTMESIYKSKVHSIVKNLSIYLLFHEQNDKII